MGQAICIRKDEKPLGYDWECGHEELYVRVNMYYNGSLYVGLWQKQEECEEKLELFGDLTIQRCLDYVTQKAYNIALEGAKKKGENGIRANTGLALSGDQVFPWVLEYYAKDDEKEIAEKEQEEKKKIQKEWDSVNKRTKTIPKNPGTKKDSEVHPKEAAKQEEKYISKKKSKDSGQMSLFDMMQPKES